MEQERVEASALRFPVAQGTPERRRVQTEFIARGLRSGDEARGMGEYVDADVVLEGLQRNLDSARAHLAKKRK